MDIAPIGPEEQQRLHTLSLYDILDTDAEDTFDDLTELAAEIFQAPISLVTIIDKHRQWFKSRYGLDTEETSRDLAFCAHTILTDEPMVVTDAHTDTRFADNPLVLDAPFVRFYAGAPLKVADGSCLGTLCIVDHVPRSIGPAKLKALKVLRDAVVAQLELRRLRDHASANEDVVTMCAWCARIKADTQPQDNVSWVSAGDYLEHTSTVTHGICPSCRKQMLAES